MSLFLMCVYCDNLLNFQVNIYTDYPDEGKFLFLKKI